MKTKLTAIVLSLAVALLAGGCAGRFYAPRGIVEPNAPSPAPSEAVTAPETQAPDGQDTFRAGAVEGGTYTNAMLGLGCTLDDDWTFASDEEIAATFGTVMELIEQAQTGIDLNEGDGFTDLYVYADDGLVNMNVRVEKLGVLASGMMAQIDEDELLDDVLETLAPTLESVYSELGTVDFEKVDAVFLGEPHRAISMVTTFNDMDMKMYQKQVYLTRGRYSTVITCSSMSVDMTDDLLALFYAV